MRLILTQVFIEHQGTFVLLLQMQKHKALQNPGTTVDNAHMF